MLGMKLSVQRDGGGCTQQKVKVKVVSDSCDRHGLFSPWNSPGQNTGVGSLSLLQGISSTQGLNPGLQHCRRLLYQLSYQGHPAEKAEGSKFKAMK